MKKILLALFAIVTIMSCEGPAGPMGRPGFDGQDGDGNTNYVKYSYIISPNEWKDGGSNGEFYISAPIYIRELNNRVFSEGSVNVKYAMDNYVKTVLPYTRHFDDGEFYFTQTISYEYEIGEIRLYIETSDFVIQKPNSNMRFDIELIWPS